MENFASECHISKMLARQKAILSLRVHDSERGNLSSFVITRLDRVIQFVFSWIYPKGHFARLRGNDEFILEIISA
jgi:hypothetical protein